jgi:isopenicillin N synthase-like dioxygenase
LFVVVRLHWSQVGPFGDNPGLRRQKYFNGDGWRQFANHRNRFSDDHSEEMRDLCRAVYEECNTVCKQLLEALSLQSGIDLLKLHDCEDNYIEFKKYEHAEVETNTAAATTTNNISSRIAEIDEAERRAVLSTHADLSSLTLLLQWPLDDTGCVALEVRDEARQTWLQAPPIEG